MSCKFPKDILNLLITEYFDGQTLINCLFVSKYFSSCVPLDKVDKARVEYALDQFRKRQNLFMREELEKIVIRKIQRLRFRKAMHGGKKMRDSDFSVQSGKSKQHNCPYPATKYFVRCPQCNEVYKETKLESHVKCCVKQYCKSCHSRTGAWNNEHQAYIQDVHRHDTHCSRIQFCEQCLCEFPNWPNSPHKTQDCPMKIISCRYCFKEKIDSSVSIRFHERICQKSVATCYP